MWGWIGDLGRYSWGLIYWNARKTLFRMRGASGAAPCQHPSDSGEALVTGCEACRGWDKPARFHRVCPLVAFREDGRAVCSAASKEVRPFWGRAFAAYVSVAVAVFALAVGGAFATFRAIGYKVPLSTLVWPGHWGRVRKARADYFYEMARKSLSKGEIRQGFLALGQVYALDPDNMEAAALLARLAQIPNPDFSDGIYARLLERTHNDEGIALTWFRSLLARGDFGGVAAVSASMLKAGAPHDGAWLQGLRFAARQGADLTAVHKLLENPGRASEASLRILRLDQSLAAAPVEMQLPRMQRALLESRSPMEIYCVVRLMLDGGYSAAALEALDSRSTASLESYDRLSLRLDAYASLGWSILEQGDIDALLQSSPSATSVTFLCGHLIRHPNAPLARRVFAILESHPLVARGVPANIGAHMALLCMAGANGLNDSLQKEADILADALGGTLAAKGRIEDYFAAPRGRADPSLFLPALDPLPLDVIYALEATGRTHAAATAHAPDQAR